MIKIEELIQYFNIAYGIEHEWPKTFEVSPELYGRCCQAVFDVAFDRQEGDYFGDFKLIRIAVGTKGVGLMFKNVELRIKKDDN